MALYEVGMVLSQELTGEDRDAFLGEIKQLLANGGASIVKEDVWGKRTLAYRIKHQREGFYVFWQFEAPGTAIAPLEYRLRLSDQVLRYITLNLDQEMRRKRKMDIKRAERKAKKPPKAVAGQAPAAPAGQGA